MKQPGKTPTLLRPSRTGATVKIFTGAKTPEQLIETLIAEGVFNRAGVANDATRLRLAIDPRTETTPS